MLAVAALALAACGPSGGASQAPSAAASPTQAAAVTTQPTQDACAKANLSTLTPGKLTIGADNPAYPPYYTPDDPAPAGSPWELGEPTNGQGLEAATAYAVAYGLGFVKSEVEWLPVLFNTAIQPGDKTFDMYLTQVSYSAERAAVVDLSDGYFDLNQAVVALKDTPIASVTTVEGLKPFKLGSQTGTTSYQYIVDQIKPTTEASAYDSMDAALQALQNGQIDGVVADLPTTFYMRDAQLDNGTIVGSLPTAPGADVEHFSILLTKGSPLTACVNKVLATMKTSGVLEAITKRYIEQQGAPELE
jgi:polar amino acid transport system substrate-binding protein